VFEVEEGCEEGNIEVGSTSFLPSMILFDVAGEEWDNIVRTSDGTKGPVGINGRHAVADG